MQKGKVFMAMPFEEQFFNTFEILKNEFKKDFEFIHAGETSSQQNILKDIIQNIYDADIIIADLTGLNPNVFYELGIAHTLNKKVIIITKDIESLPFDLKSYRAKEYNETFLNFKELLEYLHQNLNGAISGDIIFSNPVKDFLVKDDKKEALNNENLNTAEIDSEKGYLDFIAGIEANSKKLENNILFITKDLQNVTDITTEVTATIEKANRQPYGSNAAFVKQQTVKIAKSLNIFSENLKVHNAENTELWNKIEKDSVGLIENKFTQQEDNKENLKTYILSLIEMKEQLCPTLKSVQDFKNGLENLKGMEQTLTQSINFCIRHLNDHLSFLHQITYSIDRLIEKSNSITEIKA